MAKKGFQLKSPYTANGERKPVALAPLPEPVKWVRTTIAILPEQLQYLRTQALERAQAKGGAAKADASELLREILAERMRGRK